MECPSYTPELATEICKRLAEGESLREICRDPHIPHRETVTKWATADVQGFAVRYAEARDSYLDLMADETLAIADTPQLGEKTKSTALGVEVMEGDMIEHRRLRVDTRKWYLSKLAPKRYGDRLAHELSGPDGKPIETTSDSEHAGKLFADIAALVVALTPLGQSQVAAAGRTTADGVPE